MSGVRLCPKHPSIRQVLKNILIPLAFKLSERIWTFLKLTLRMGQNVSIASLTYLTYPADPLDVLLAFCTKPMYEVLRCFNTLTLLLLFSAKLLKKL